jgi:hypothetical protein
MGVLIMRERNTFAKRQRETGKKQKAADKRARRQKRQESTRDADPSALAVPTVEQPADGQEHHD